MESAESKVLCSWDNIQILSLVHSLEYPIRKVMYLRLVRDLTSGQIREIMRRSKNQVRATYHRGRERVVKGVGEI